MTDRLAHVYDSFNAHFTIVNADTEALRQAVYALRYLVYCLEIGGYPPTAYPDGQEKDQYDPHSLHFLIRHNRSGAYIATTRLILPPPAGPLPIERHCQIDHSPQIAALDRGRLAEVSRFCVSKSFKRRPNESRTLTGLAEDGPLPELGGPQCSGEERRAFPHITLGLIASVIRACHHQPIDHLYATMENALLRFLAAVGIRFAKIGPVAAYHGQRWPCLIRVSELLAQVQRTTPGLLRLLTNDGRF